MQIYRVIVYAFPCLLILLENLLRNSVKVDSQEFIGPTLASVGLGLFVALLPPRTMQVPGRPELRIVPAAQLDFVGLVLLALVVSIALWFFSLTLTLNHQDGMHFGLRRSIWLGLTVYFAGCLFTEIKERIT